MDIQFIIDEISRQTAPPIRYFMDRERYLIHDVSLIQQCPHFSPEKVYDIQRDLFVLADIQPLIEAIQDGLKSRDLGPSQVWGLAQLTYQVLKESVPASEDHGSNGLCPHCFVNYLEE